MRQLEVTMTYLAFTIVALLIVEKIWPKSVLMHLSIGYFVIGLALLLGAYIYKTY